ncbi:FadR/GntR family transcriptional regulator [Jiangella anatolica]|uniref:FadR/GntR family transcriptional regulator n=1 Tax=Jiangella anatolica TaxID=2670374 RepID=UPI0013144A95|nr:FadR/GntR family transcriptional regulator [Jiangella anatolica]
MATRQDRRESGGGPTLLHAIKELILDRGLRPGDRLPTEHQLSDQLGASRNAVREALQALQVQGILEIRHGHGIYLREVTLDGLTDILTFWARLTEPDGLKSLLPIAEVREILEVNLLRAVVPLLAPADLDELVAIVEDMEARAERDDWAIEVDRRFHDVLYRPLGNWVVVFLLQAFWDAISSISEHHDLSIPPPARIAQQHRNIVTALQRGDADAAVAAMSGHFDNQLHRTRA